MDDIARERRALELFEACAAVAPADRERWIAEQTAGDDVLERRLRSLLAAERKANMRTGGAWLPDEDDEAAQPLPHRIGAYRIVGIIGRGGMGSVYRGERDTGDFDHAVAIKVIKPGLLSEALAERFKRERQTLAQLSHPHIAQLFDGGETADGAPYIVMELVDGRSLKRWVEEEEPPRAERLAMFDAICQAVAFAHRNLVVHRDLTPSNVLVTRNGTPKLIDFGIAKAPDPGPALDEAQPASIGSLSLTPGYAAPERMVSASVSTAADIFSLGKLLAWLVPSGDTELAAIVTRATATDPDARYATAEALAEDVRAWRDGLPVTAMAGGRRYVAAKFIRRNRTRLALAALALVLLLGALAYALVANHRAQVARAEAETRFRDLRSLAGYMLFDLNRQLARVPGNTAARAALAEQAQRYLSSLARTPGAEPDLTLETARGLLRLAQIQGVPNEPNLGEHAKALANLDEADRLLATLPAADPEAATSRGLSGVYRSLILSHGEGDEPGAKAALDKAEQTLAAVPAPARTLRWTQALSALRIAQLDFADISDQRPTIAGILARADADRAAWNAGQRADFDNRSAQAMLTYYRGILHSDSDFEKALAFHLQARAEFDALLRERHDDPLLLYRAAWNGADGFSAASRAGKEDVSDALIRHAAAIIDRLALIDDRDESVRALQSNIKEALAQNLRDADRFDEAIAAAEQVVALRKTAVANNPDPKTIGNLGFSQMILGIIQRDAGHRAPACAAWRDALASLKRVDATGQILGFHKGFIPGIEAHVRACETGGAIDFPMR